MYVCLARLDSVDSQKLGGTRTKYPPQSNANEEEMPRTPMLLRLAKKATLSLSGTLLEAGFEVASVTGGYDRATVRPLEPLVVAMAALCLISE